MSIQKKVVCFNVFFKEMGVSWFVISAGSKKIGEMRLHYLWKMNNPFLFFLLKMSE
jgi:hypothetical protein